MSSQPPNLFNWLNKQWNGIRRDFQRNNWLRLSFRAASILFLGFSPDIRVFKGLLTETVFNSPPNWYGKVFLLMEAIIVVIGFFLEWRLKINRQVGGQIANPPRRFQGLLLFTRKLLLFTVLCVGLFSILQWIPSTFAPRSPIASEFKCEVRAKNDLQTQKDCFSWGENILIDKAAFTGKEEWKKTCKGAWNSKESGSNHYLEDIKKVDSPSASEFKTFVESNCENDPEARIYWSNVEAERVGNPFRIAVSVPISRTNGGTSDSQEILRGVALAQYQINHDQEGSVYNNRKLVVGITDDGYVGETADLERKAAQEAAMVLSENKDILAVIGHSSSDATEAAAEIYNMKEQELVAISPTSTAVRKKNSGDVDPDKVDLGVYVFRTASNDEIAVRELMKRVRESRFTSIGIVYDGDSKYVRSFKEAFKKLYQDSEGGKVVNDLLDKKECDISKELVPSQECFKKITQTKLPDGTVAQALLLVPSGDTASYLEPSSNKENIIKLNSEQKSPLPLLGSDTMYNEEFLRKQSKDMIVAVPWHRQNPQSDFEKNAKILFGYTDSQTGKREPFKINWETAMAYDATQALAKGLKEAAMSSACAWYSVPPWNKDAQSSCLRKELKKALERNEFKAKGVLGDDSVSFENGDRVKVEGLGILVTVCEVAAGKYEFQKTTESCPSL